MTEKKKKTSTPKPKLVPRALVTLLNQGTAPITLVLHHQQVCVKGGLCLCKDGKPNSVHLPVDVPARDLDASVMLCDDAKRAGKAIKIFHGGQVPQDVRIAAQVKEAEMKRKHGSRGKAVEAHKKEMKAEHDRQVKAAKKTGKDEGKGAAKGEGGKTK